MDSEEYDHRRYTTQPVVTMVHECHSSEATAVGNLTSPAGSESEPVAPEVAAVLARETRRLGRVLVVDSDEVVRRLIAANLLLEGFEVATAVDGQDCLDKVSVIAPDVITLEVNMPRLDGWETAIRLRKRQDTSHIKVLLIAACGREGDQTRRVDADAYLTKPFDAGEIIRVVRKLAGTPPDSFAWTARAMWSS
jgi:CheY-like chemotaxis protein